MMTQAQFQQISAEYQQRFGIQLLGVDARGDLRHGAPACERPACRAECAEHRRRTVFEALRWGEPSINCCPAGYGIWGVPLMENSRVYGGLVAVGIPLAKDPPGTAFSSAKIREACDGLRLLAEENNLTNAALLHLHRLELGRETEKAEAIHLLKTNVYDGIREVYLREEAALLAAVKRGERREARKILNRVLVGIYHFGGQRLDLLKSVVLELVVILCRAAVEAGGEPSELLGGNYRSVTALSAIADEQQLCVWLTDMLERQMDAIRDNRQYPNTVLLGKALSYLKDHRGEEVRREDVARHAGLSASHFSRLLKEKLGLSYTELLRQYRVDHAKELLVRTTKTLVEVSTEAGFSDQSYFTKVFQRSTGLTPGEYRRQHAAWRF